MSLLCYYIVYYLLFINLFVQASELYCIKHQHRAHDTLQKCQISKERPISVIALSNDDVAMKIKHNKLHFDLNCLASDSECESVHATIKMATEMISRVFRFETRLIISASYFSFCTKFNDCTEKSDYASIGEAYPSISYIMVDNTDNLIRMYPQPLLKQFTDLDIKPNWIHYDINAQFNSDVNWYFVDNPNEINQGQTDFLRNVIHEIIHGLGFVTSWSDSFYSDLAPLFPMNINKFITPFLLASAENKGSLTNYQASQPFWGFVEFPFDKFISYTTSSGELESFTNITQQLNKFGNSNIMFKNTVDLANAWYNSDAYHQASQIYIKANTSLDVMAVVDNELNIWLETAIPFLSGSSLCHVSEAIYLNTSDYLMVYFANKGVDLNQLDSLYPDGPIGPKLRTLMGALGYRMHNTSIKTIRPNLSYWSPAQDLVGTKSNPQPSLSVYTNGPARIPVANKTPISEHVSSSATRNPTYHHVSILIVFITLLLI